MRTRIALVVCVLVLSAGAAWAQPAPPAEGPAWTAWGSWLQGVQGWLLELWTGELEGSKTVPAYQAAQDSGEDDSNDLDLSGGVTSANDSCEPGLFESCSADPNG